MKKFFLSVAVMLSAATMSVNAQSVLDYTDNDIYEAGMFICSHSKIQNMKMAGRQYICQWIDIFLTNETYKKIEPAEAAKLWSALNECVANDYNDATLSRLLAYMSVVNLDATVELIDMGSHITMFRPSAK